MTQNYKKKLSMTTHMNPDHNSKHDGNLFV